MSDRDPIHPDLLPKYVANLLAYTGFLLAGLFIFINGDKFYYLNFIYKICISISIFFLFVSGFLSLWSQAKSIDYARAVERGDSNDAIDRARVKAIVLSNISIFITLIFSFLSILIVLIFVVLYEKSPKISGRQFLLTVERDFPNGKVHFKGEIHCYLRIERNIYNAPDELCVLLK
ncbi:hypothetical protein [Oceanibaculum nanhaiense]|uniref:hypothetical protein n=1 Tax=Oceanibaculum nanhaiense TaxID=1909734 RepID=UPI003F7276BE